MDIKTRNHVLKLKAEDLFYSAYTGNLGAANEDKETLFMMLDSLCHDLEFIQKEFAEYREHGSSEWNQY